MARFRTVEVYPYGGHIDAPWTPDADTDAFARTARRVCEAYSRALAPQDLHGKNSTLLLRLDKTPDLDHVHVLVHTDYWEGHEHAGVSLPTGIATLTPQARARLVLDVVHGACLRLAQARSMDATRLEHVRDAVLADGLRFVWTSSTKTSADRRYLAQAHFELADDGFGRARILVRRRTDGQLVAVSDEQLAYSSSEGFARAAKTLRWQGSRRLELIPYSDWLGRTRDSMLVVLPGPSPTSQAAAGVAEPTPVVMPVLMPAVEAAGDDPHRPRVAVQGRGADAPEGNDFPQWIQGGARFFVSGYDLFGYAQCLDAVVEAMAVAPEWNQWWQPAGEPGVDLGVHVLAPDADDVWPTTLRALEAVTTRRFKDRVEVQYRTTVPVPDAPMEEMAQWVRRDLSRAITKLKTRFKLAAPPELPQLDDAALQAARARAEAWARNAES